MQRLALRASAQLHADNRWRQLPAPQSSTTSCQQRCSPRQQRRQRPDRAPGAHPPLRCAAHRAAQDLPSGGSSGGSGIHRREALLRGVAAAAAACAAAAPGPPRSLAAVFVDEDTAAAVFRSVSPSVASIAVVRPVAGVEVSEVVGSGLVWDGVGPHVLTNFHIIPPLKGSATTLRVTLTDASTGGPVTLGARVVGTDSLHDLAVLQLLPATAPDQQQQQQQQQQQLLPAGGDSAGGAAASSSAREGSEEGSERASRGWLPAVAPIRLGSSADLKVGQTVYALGSTGSTNTALAGPRAAGSGPPPRPDLTLSAGLVSGLDRSIPSPVGGRIYGVVQTDALINAANSGGPLLDSYGRLVGLNTAAGSSRAGQVRGSGVNFALPADLLLELVPRLIVYGNAYGKRV